MKKTSVYDGLGAISEKLDIDSEDKMNIMRIKNKIEQLQREQWSIIQDIENFVASDYQKSRLRKINSQIISCL